MGRLVGKARYRDILLGAGLLWATVGGAVIVGVLYAMGQRLREIDSGEEEDAKKY